ncbi:hypothetical protein [Hydrogenobaculum acidophilum]
MMQEADNTVVELDKVLISSMRDMIRAKAYELKQTNVDEDIARAIDHIERVARYTEKLEDLEKKVKNNTFNGYLSNAEIVIMKIVESVLKDIEKLQEKEGVYLNQLKLSIYESLNEIASIIEKYLD